jgi:hypothetical protein
MLDRHEGEIVDRHDVKYAAQARRGFLTAAVTFLSTISGYSLGYWFATTHGVSCDSYPVRERLENLAYWPEMVRRYAMAVAIAIVTEFPPDIEGRSRRRERGNLAATFRETLPIRNPALECNFPWMPTLESLSKLEIAGTQVNAADILRLERLAAIMKRLKPLPEYQAMTKDDLNSSSLAALAAKASQFPQFEATSAAFDRCEPLLDGPCDEKGENSQPQATQTEPKMSRGSRCDRLNAAYQRALAAAESARHAMPR